jgi:hypothetical protein
VTQRVKLAQGLARPSARFARTAAWSSRTDHALVKTVTSGMEQLVRTATPAVILALGRASASATGVSTSRMIQLVRSVTAAVILAVDPLRPTAHNAPRAGAFQRTSASARAASTRMMRLARSVISAVRPALEGVLWTASHARLASSLSLQEHVVALGLAAK